MRSVAPAGSCRGILARTEVGRGGRGIVLGAEGMAKWRYVFSLLLVGESPFGPFQIHGTGQIVRHPPEAYFYAAQLVRLRDQWYLLATAHDEASEHISDPVAVYAYSTGVHELR